MQNPIHVSTALLSLLTVAHTPFPRAPFDVETKNDASPVTIADKQAELAMRELLAEVRTHQEG